METAKTTYEIYPGGKRGGEIIISGPLPDENGIAVMPLEEYENSFGGFRSAEHVDYDVTTDKRVAVIHPRHISFDDVRVQKYLQNGGGN